MSKPINTERCENKSVKKVSRLSLASVICLMAGLIFGEIFYSLNYRRLAGLTFLLFTGIAILVGFISIFTIIKHRQKLRGLIYAIISILVSFAFINEVMYGYMRNRKSLLKNQINQHANEPNKPEMKYQEN